MTQGIQSLMMIVGISVVLFLVNVKLAAFALIAMPAVFVLAFSFARKVMPISRQVQQLKADVTEAADEAVVGVEMVQAFGREDDVQERFARKAEAVRDGVLRQARVEAAFLPGLLFLPTLSIGAVVYFGGRSEEHTSELQSLRHLVCRLLLEKKKYYYSFVLDFILTNSENNKSFT